MDLTKYKYFYVNGCSHCEGGGLEEPEIRENSVVPEYQKKYNVTWSNRSEVNFGKRLSDIIGVPCINESKCGGGVERLVRKTYDFIYEHWDKKDQFFLILEKPDSTRSEFYFNEIGDYFISNSNFMGPERILEYGFSTRSYFNKDIYETDIKYQTKFKQWFLDFFNFEENLKKNEHQFIGLYSFCKMNDIKIFIMSPNEIYFRKCFLREDIISFDKYNFGDDIVGWCKRNKLLIKNELSGISNDQHPGYFGHIEYAKQLAEFLQKKEEIKKDKKLI
jgi:hypothetical protein